MESGGGGAEDGVEPRFTFAHLSDIHFAGYQPGAVFDINSDIRRELVIDLHALVARAGPLDAILISGDIAGKGQQSEYEAAAGWIDELCREFEVPLEMVFCVPGNHDVYRPAITEDSVLAVAQKSLLECRLENFDPLLEKLFMNSQHPGLLMRGLEPYNEFAARYRCEMDLSQQRWSWTTEMGDLKIHLVGLASAILCGPEDVRKAEHSHLALGPQARIPRFVDGTVTIILCHHPPAWLRDYSGVATFIERAHLQLYGHEHSFGLTPSGKGFRVDAGAVHPSRDEDPWLPSYNLISLYRADGDPSEITVDFYPRCLQDNQTFSAMEAGEDMRRETISVLAPETTGGPPEPAAESPPADPIEERQIARRFVGLDRDTRLRIGVDLGLIGEAEKRLPEGVRLRHVFDRARAEGRLTELGEKIDA
jgi:predicted MPP superfamily phosphohydrolase